MWMPRMRPTQADYDRYIWLVQFGPASGLGRGRDRRRKPVHSGRSDDDLHLLRSTRDLRWRRSWGEGTEIDGWIARLEGGAASSGTPKRVPDGTPCGGANFTWTAAIWLAWASPARKGGVMGAIELKAVEKWFGEVQVIKGVDLTIADGEFVVFVGPSGCGKSTLLRMIGGLERPRAGSS
jgi:ABC-type multidrug transport system fused ATPase/permease subunit